MTNDDMHTHCPKCNSTAITSVYCTNGPTSAFIRYKKCLPTKPHMHRQCECGMCWTSLVADQDPRPPASA